MSRLRLRPVCHAANMECGDCTPSPPRAAPPLPRPLPRPPGIDHPVTGTRHGSWETWKQIVSSHHDTGLSIFEDNSCIGNSHKFDGKQICISESVGACFHLHLPPIISVTKSHDNYVTKLPNVQCGNYFLIISIIV